MWPESLEAVGMQVWTDGNGRKWTLRIDVHALKRVKAETSINLADLSLKEGTAWPTLLTDPVELFSVVWSLIGRQAEERGVDELTFAEGFVGDAMERAAESLWLAVADFIPAQRRSLMQSLWARLKQADSQNIAEAAKLLDADSPTPTIGNSEPATDLPVSWESTLEP